MLKQKVNENGSACGGLYKSWYAASMHCMQECANKPPSQHHPHTHATDCWLRSTSRYGLVCMIDGRVGGAARPF